MAVLYFSILDLAKWDAALYSQKLLKQPSFEQMWTVTRLANGQPNSGHYGFAWFSETKDGHRVLDHSGAWQGFETHISRYIDDKLTVVVLSNLADADTGVVADRIADLYLNAADHSGSLNLFQDK